MNDKELNHDYSFHVLHEQVAKTDLFEDKTHEKVATTLNTLMNQEKYGLTIGLEGSWGSGKSTIINILRQKLQEENKKVFFFAFDAWAHDGDPLRKIFLESLIDSIESSSEDEKLIELKNKVSARKKTVTVNSEKSASKLGKYLSTVAILVPAGAALLNQTPYDSLVWPFNESATSPSFRLIFGLLFAFGPLLMIVYWWLWGEKNSKGKTKWDFFESESTENYTQDITEDGERTSIEFEKFFDEIMSHLFSSESTTTYEQAVIVIDNLDRVDPDYAQTIWSTLQTFFQHRSSSLNPKSLDWKDKLWFLIPFDREAIQKIWQSDSFQVQHNDNDLKADNGKIGAASKSIVATSFMEKSFQITIEVPPPVMSAWIDYFKKCVDKSCHGWPEEFKDEYIESYIKCMSKLDKSPSPRYIHSTINRVGILALHWKNEFSAESLCIYSLARQSMTENEFRNTLLKEGIPGSFPISLEESQIKPELAGLLFGVSADKGTQLLLSPEIRSSIFKGDGKKLKELRENHQDAFWLALRASENEWIVQNSNSDGYLINAIASLHDAFLDEVEYIYEYTNRIETIFIHSFKDLNFEKYSYVETVQKLIKVIKNEKCFIESLNSKFKIRMNSLVKSVGTEKFSRPELLGLSEIEAILFTNDSTIKKFRYSFTYEDWKIWITECSDENVIINTVLPRTNIYEQIVANCGFSSNQLKTENFKVLINSLKIDSDISNWKTLVPSVINWLNLPSRESDIEPFYSFIINIISMLKGNSREKLEECIKSPEFWQRSRHSSIEKNPTLPFLVTILDEDYRNNTQVPEFIKDYLLQEFEEDKLDWILNLFRQADSLHTIWELARYKENKFAIHILETSNDSDLFSCDARYFDEINWSNESVLKAVIIKVCESGALENIHEDMKENIHLYHRSINLLTRYGTHDAKNFAISLLKNLTKDQWLEAFEKENELLLCVPESVPAFSLAWSSYFKQIFSNVSSSPHHDNLKLFWDLKSKVLDIELHIEDLTKTYFQPNDKDPLDDIGFMLIAPSIEPYIKNVDQRNLERRLIIWIDSNHIQKINWLLDIPINFSEEHQETLVAQVTQHLSSKDSDNFQMYKRLNEKLGLEVPINKCKNHKSQVQVDNEDK
ncbi:P-loop NTPase fold protein [Psychrobacter aestuarii]|uniref:KAP NTPase domain-containing protein n=1 Tax=Psychrobacter aestuarii TaxID=556327 RepID=A0ABN0VX47_9GAMM|nr:P-loop NTPase fold protein [Psychrobacter aestuarii]